MPLKNYSTEVPAMKSIGEIYGKLVAHGATDILIQHNPVTHEPESLSFIVPTKQGRVPFRLPANVPAVATKLLKDLASSTYRQWDSQYQAQRKQKAEQQAARVAWRILKDWIDAQLAIIEVEMVTMEQVFLPYMQVKDGQTLYEVIEARGFQLPEGRG